MAVQLPDTATADSRHDCDGPRGCQYCGAHVTTDFRRSYGTNDRRAMRCPACDSWARILRGSAAGKTVDHPDPQDNPGHSAGRKLRTETDVVADGGDPQ